MLAMSSQLFKAISSFFTLGCHEFSYPCHQFTTDLQHVFQHFSTQSNSFNRCFSLFRDFRCFFFFETCVSYLGYCVTATLNKQMTGPYSRFFISFPHRLSLCLQLFHHLGHFGNVVFKFSNIVHRLHWVFMDCQTNFSTLFFCFDQVFKIILTTSPWFFIGA